MPYQATTFNVMIASPSDVAAERAAIRQTLADWNVIHSESRRIVLLPIGWETHSSPQMGQHPQKVLNEQILDRSDLLVGVFWTRIGTPTPTHPSGSVEEIEEHISAGKPVMLYFSNQPVRLDSVDGEQYAKLSDFKALCQERGFFEEYSDIAEFREKFFRQLQLKLNDDPYFAAAESGSQVVEFSASQPVLSEEAKLLLAAAAQGDGVIMRLAYLGGTDVQAGGRNFIESDDRRSVAKWEAAVDELEREGLTQDKAGKRELYFVTHEGFRVADALPKST
jgi:hypothetical protein